MSAFLGYHQCFETGLTRHVGEFYQGHRVIREKSWSVLGTPSYYQKNLRDEIRQELKDDFISI